MQAQLAHARSDARVGFLFDQLSGGDERIPGSASFVYVFDGRLRMIPSLISYSVFSPFPASHPLLMSKLYTLLQQPYSPN
jgi:hypothetical protein